MGAYSNFLDTPNAINVEGQEISLVFTRTSDTTGTLSWNIPTPSEGCSSATQAYNGIVLTVDSQPADYTTTSPVNGSYYTGDPSVDPDTNMGSRLGTALVVGAFYDNKITTSLNVTDLTPLTAYYFSAYAVDNVARYYTPGVHSYSLPTGAERANSEVNRSAIQDIGIEWSQNSGTNCLTPHSWTGLKESKQYALTMAIDGKQYKLAIDGAKSLDYANLIQTINSEFIRLTENKYSAPNPPNTGNYYVDIPDQIVSQWNGYVPTIVPCEFENDDPSTPITGTFWYNPTSEVLSMWNGSSWTPEPYLTSDYDFSNPSCYQFWFNGTNVYEWEKVLWCQLPTYVQTTNPLIPAPLDCNSFWYNSTTMLISQWDVQLQAWDSVNAIYADYDPNTIASGAFWYNSTLNTVNFRSGSAWNLLNVNMVEPAADGTYPNELFANIYWFVPSTKTLYKRDAGNTIWVQKDVITFAFDPTNRSSCELWWNSVTDILYIWDIVNTRWTKVSQFFQQAIDPSLPLNIPLNSAWLNPVTNVLTIINNPDCIVANFVYDATDPTIMTLNEIWYNPSTNIWSQWNGSGWNQISVVVKTTDPYVLTTGELWFNTAANQLNQWNGSAWVNISYSTVPLTPTINSLWHNTSTDTMYEWDGTTWVLTIGVAAAKLVLRHNHGCEKCSVDNCGWEYFNDLNDGWEVPCDKDFIRFYTNLEGCCESIEICWDEFGGYNYGGYQQVYIAQELYQPPPPVNQDLLFANLGYLVYFRPQRGYTALSSPPSYEQLGVGTDGDPSERRELQSIIRANLGAPSIIVELTKTQLNICIDNALKVLRKNSTLAYNRAFFFLDVFPMQQTYLLKDECVGFNRITDVNAIYRCGGFFGAGSGFAGDGLFVYGALQQMYSNIGTFDTLTYHMTAAYLKELQILFANNITFQWIELTRQLKMFKTFYGFERVLIDGTIERTEQDLLLDRETTMWIQRYATALAKLQLSQIRGLYVTLPGANGNTTLNAQDMIAQANQEMETLEAELHDPVMSGVNTLGLRSTLIFG